MSEEIVSALSRKDADFLEKFVRKLLLIAKADKAERVNLAYAKLREDPASYNTSFDEWQRIALTIVVVDEEIEAKKDRLTPDEEKK